MADAKRQAAIAHKLTEIDNPAARAAHNALKQAFEIPSAPSLPTVAMTPAKRWRGCDWLPRVRALMR
ncbi:MAG: hypothetical protein AAF614_22860 [Chloroflexota bacterium]